MKKPIRVRQLTNEEHAALLRGTKSKSGFTVRRSHILLLSAEGKIAREIAQQLHCGGQTVRQTIRAFEREGLGCLQEKSRRPLTDKRVFDQAGLEALEKLVHRSPREYGKESSLWSLPLLAQVCFEQGIVQRPISYEAVRRALKQLNIDWGSARHQIISHDPLYEVKKTAGSSDAVGNE